jgi:hypothetical protein
LVLSTLTATPSSNFRPRFFLVLNNFFFRFLRIRFFSLGSLFLLSSPVCLRLTRSGLFFFHRVTFGHFRSQFSLRSICSSILRLKGIGYKCWRRGKGLFFDLAKSHFFCLAVPLGVNVLLRRRRGIIILGSDSKLVSNFSLKIRAFAFPNPYTGKGVRFLGEFKRLKPGKQRRR